MINRYLTLKIVTPEKVYTEEKVSFITVVTDNGEVTILPNHTEYLANIEISVLTIDKDGHREKFAVGGGAIRFDEINNVAILILNSICSPDEVDIIKLKRQEEILRSEISSAKSLNEQKVAERNLKEIINRMSLKN